MESPEQKIERQGQFAETLLTTTEWGELLNDVRDRVVAEWMNGATVEAREQAHAKIVALGVTHQVVKVWQDRKTVQGMQAEQKQGTSAL
jgi:hypothetical protein